MSYSLEPLQDDCYEGTTVLMNKFGIKDDAKLDMVERDITSALIAKAYIEIIFVYAPKKYGEEHRFFKNRYRSAHDSNNKSHKRRCLYAL